MKHVLILGATGAMGQYLVPELLSLGYAVTGVTLDNTVSDDPRLTYVKANVKEPGVLEDLLTHHFDGHTHHFDGVVDFMTWQTAEFRKVYPIFLANTDHYIYLSSCRVFADAPPITERSPRLLDVSDDQYFLSTEDYALYKAREEDMLRQSGSRNWTIVRPATTFSRGRFQLVTLEAETLLHRMLAGKTVVLPAEAMDKEATLSWGGDVARMLARLLFCPDAYGDDFNVATGEHHTWREIAAYYNELCPFRYIEVPAEDYLDIIAAGADWAKYQLLYARMFTRITDNTKILHITGMNQSQLKPLREGLAHEFARSKDFDWGRFAGDYRNTRMDAYLAKRGIE